MPEQDSQTPVSPPAVDSTTATDTESADKPKLTDAQIATFMKTRVAASKREKKALVSDWRRNVEDRLGHVPSRYTNGVDLGDEAQSEINPDWSLTKTKTANLFSRVPPIRLSHENKQFAPALPPFAKAINYEIGAKRANVGVAMEETLNDVVNAAGVGAVVVGYAARFNEKLAPAIDTKLIPPEVLQMLTETEVPEKDLPSMQDPNKVSEMLMARQMPMRRVKQVVSDKIFARRVSPVDLLWPVEFTGSNFDDADHMGYTGRCSWPDGKLEFNLKDEDYDKVISGTDDSGAEESLRSNPEQSGLRDTKTMKFDRIYYWRSRLDPDEKHFECIWEIVYVHGLDKPAVHRPWPGQRLVGDKYVGNIRFPVRVCTLTYITDNPIPPSDTAAGRPQVNDMRRSRRDMFANRERSIPIRWFDVNRIDQTIQTMLMRGTWQGMIPTNGDGSRSIGEIARASYPSENIQFDQQAQADLMQSWQVGPNQLGTQVPGEQTAAAANITQQNFSTRIGQERNRVGDFFLSIVEQVAGNLVLFSDFPILTEQEKGQMQQAWDMKTVLQDLVFKILPDSQIEVDSNTRIQKISNFMNLTVKSGYVNPKPLIIEMAELSGIDPSEVVVDPQPPKPEDPNISYRFSGKDDLQNPMVVAMLMEKGEIPSMDTIMAAQALLLKLQAGPQPPGAETPPAGPEGAPGPTPPGPGAPPGPPADPTNIAHPDWHTASKVAQRSEDAQA
jgi:hypothetical protein